MLAVQVLERARAGVGPVETGPFEGMPGLLAVIAESGPVTAEGVARLANLPGFDAAGWTARRAAEGYLHRDEVTGRYAPWCHLPHPAAITAKGHRPAASRRRRLADFLESALGVMALTWFGLLGDHLVWPEEEAALNSAQPGAAGPPEAGEG